MKTKTLRFVTIFFLSLTCFMLLTSANMVKVAVRADSNDLSPSYSLLTPDNMSSLPTLQMPLGDPLNASDPYYADWSVGAVYPYGTAVQDARSVYMTCMIPNAYPLSDESYGVLLSVVDSNSSYDQIGFDDYNGAWGLVYSWTTLNNTGYPTYHPPAPLPYLDEMSLSLGTIYTFVITTANLYTSFSAYQGAAQIYNQQAPTGGNYLYLNNTYALPYNGGTIADYTVYEEVHVTDQYAGAPNFNFYFYNQYWNSTSGPVYAPTWQPYGWIGDGSPYPPNLVGVGINGEAVLVVNPGTATEPQNPPLCSMKGETNGDFYIPTPMIFLKIEMLFSNAGIVGDQSGSKSPPYPSLPNWPDGTVDVRDENFVAKIYGLKPWSIGWNPMADITGPNGYPDGKVDIRDAHAVALNYGNKGTYSTDLSNVIVTFDTGDQLSPDANGFIPMPIGATSFTITQSGNPIGAVITFWTI